MNNAEILDSLAQVIAARKGGDTSRSYVAKLFAKGTKKIAQKVGEEGVETALAAVAGDRDEVISESADLLFHLMVLWSQMDVAPEEVLQELARREGVSGIDEKNSRKD
ncbi:phosphoribosyl-ATP diphosphatase [Paremcibacter congregatus]|uniref:Phosphoribosyl-ATP pyrophosphatase n=1 Tax=Paremcibacter congregatus TaxID=2043170 RepID=A0A2G4YRS9_9PROT|nr:phosphoribosyl-ATP diphosphatase [Paremcibacter congregatus]PHZ85039.1 phosphoribosyl-ATP diphosphatase [Paremcibacter congregatus]QDE25986.1 phosphoribosyl-ATP diphosphatase [Paremcibacter congregatus]